jgi:outer membrane lipoprotein carrier protein
MMQNTGFRNCELQREKGDASLFRSFCFRLTTGNPRNREVSPFLPYFFLTVVFLLSLSTAAHALDLPEVVSGLQRRYSAVETVKGSFVQTYRAPGVHQQQSGEFWLKRPGLMRWEYRTPLEQLFVADGREFFLYVPQDRQVNVQPLTAADLRNTPLDLLLGSGNIDKNFVASWEAGFKPKMEGTVLIRLTPRAKGGEYSFLVLEIDSRSFEIRHIAIREPGGSTSEFVFANVVTNAKLDKKLFQFKFPKGKGIEVIRLDIEQ